MIPRSHATPSASWTHAACVALAGAAVLVRIWDFARVTPDMQKHLLPWYHHLSAHGPGALAENFSDYAPSYLYVLCLATASRSWLAPLAAIKGLSIVFDLAAAAIAYLIIRLYVPGVRRARVGALLLLMLPTVWVNSAVWGQCDAIYTTFLLGCVYFVLRGSPAWSMVSFGVALSFKLQAVFLLPFVAFEWWRRAYPIPLLLVPPAMYVLIGLPVVLLGRSFVDLLAIYPVQARMYTDLSISAPSVWAACFLTADRCRSGAGWLGVGAMLVAVALLVSAVLIFRRWKSRHGFESTLLAATFSALLVPFVLPRMHERYFFTADVLSFLLAVCIPRLHYVSVAAGIQLASLLAYSTYLWGWSHDALVGGAVVIAACLVGLLLVAACEPWPREAQSPPRRVGS